MITKEKIVFHSGDKYVIQTGSKFFTRVLEEGEFLESGDFNSLESAKLNLDIKPTTVECNEVLANFVGFLIRSGIVNNFEEDYNYYVIPNGFDLLRRVDSVIEEIDFCESKDLVFHSDWAWLMKVVEKIHTLGGHVSMSFPHVFLHYPKTYKSCTMYNDDSTSNITKVFQACYEFIIWHNKENQLS